MNQRESHSLDGQIAVVTGGAQGLGLGIARQLASAGANVVIADRQEDKAREEAAKLQQEDLTVRAVALDITDSAAVTSFFAALVAEEERVDILINNAGTGQQVAPIVELEGHRMAPGDGCDLDWGVLLLPCRRTHHGRTGGRLHRQYLFDQWPESRPALVAAYNVAKAGIISLTRTLALELAAYGVRVNAVCPGPVYTEFNQRNMAQRRVTLGISEEEMIERIRTAIPLGRWGEPEDIAQGVAFLCSPAASWITGEVLRVSGGMEGVSATPPKRPRPRQ